MPFVPLWDVSYDTRAGLHVHRIAKGLGHALLAPIVADIFTILRVSAYVQEPSGRWWRLHDEPNLGAFEVEHGREGERSQYNGRCLERAYRTKKILLGERGGYSDLFTPIVLRGEVAAVLVTGPFGRARPTSADILARWRSLTDRQGHPADPEFASYLSTTLGLLVLMDGEAVLFERHLRCLAALLSGEGDARALMNRAEALRTKLESVRIVERTWEAVRAMVDERSARTWASAGHAWPLRELGLSRVADHVLVGLAVPTAPETDPVDDAVRRDALQRGAVMLGRSVGDVIAGQVGDHGIVFLSAASGRRERQRARILDLAHRADALARRRFGMSLHFGASHALGSVPLSRSYQAALGAAEAALTEGARVLWAEPGEKRLPQSLRQMRRELGLSVDERPDLLASRFDRYLEAVAVDSGYRMGSARGHLDAGVERLAEALVRAGRLEEKSYLAMCEGLDRAAGAARTMMDLFAVYRRGVGDLVQAVEKPLDARHDRSLGRAVEYVHQHYTEPLRAAQVARVAGFAVNYFSKLWKAREKVTFASYVQRLRVERAKHLLGTTGLSATRIAELSGFHSSEYFTRVFRETVGTTPIDYRQAYKKATRRPGSDAS
jgi:AraC-like DNA-binding protein